MPRIRIANVFRSRSPTSSLADIYECDDSTISSSEDEDQSSPNEDREPHGTMPPPPNQSRAKNWCFTWNNYAPADEDAIRLLQQSNPQCSYVCYGRETGESGTPHLQGFCAFTSRLRFSQVRALFGPHVHLECTRNVPAAIEYCKKDGDFVEYGNPPTTGAGQRNDLEAFKDAVKGGTLDLVTLREQHSDVYAKYPRFVHEYVQDHYPRKQLPLHPLREWQQQLNVKLNREPDDREVVFLVDRTGNTGKTWFAHYYAQMHDNVQVLLPGKKADMAYSLNCRIRVLFIDAPRSKQGEYLQYDFIEDVKNGYVFSPKYESRVKTLGKVHVVVNMNEMPDLTKLSADRYNIVEL